MNPNTSKILLIQKHKEKLQQTTDIVNSKPNYTDYNNNKKVFVCFPLEFTPFFIKSCDHILGTNIHIINFEK